MRAAALYVDPAGVYASLGGLDLWGVDRDARGYHGPGPVVAHPPCARWGWWARQHAPALVGEDGGCFAAALGVVDRTGGVIEHPRASSAWHRFDLPRPGGWGWTRGPDRPGGAAWACAVDQGHYGHPAPKRSWLYLVTPVWVDGPPPALRWEPSGAAGRVCAIRHKVDREATPAPFARLLLALATGDPSSGDLDDPGPVTGPGTGDLNLVQVCRVCRGPVTASRFGPPRVLCSPRCRQRASRQDRRPYRGAFHAAPVDGDR